MYLKITLLFFISNLLTLTVYEFTYGSYSPHSVAFASALCAALPLALILIVILKRSNDAKDNKMRKLETVRKDFVANVSHELKTPVTAIKGFVETLLEGALESREDAHRFLSIILRQADRINAIIEDLLTLSRLEEEEKRSLIIIEEIDVVPVLRRVVHDASHAARDKKIGMRLEVPDKLVFPINANLIEQAVLNLVDNAIKYSDSGSNVTIALAQAPTEIVIEIKDSGSGIPEEHLSRIFERFYRVDKARSRKVGGTGLGLAIVKHIAQVHGGMARVQSTVGKGSVFSIHLPKSAQG
jgi:two-component system phosphate regulon sensor histidine kinase PhoR